MIENYKREFLKEYNTLDEAIVELKEYCKNDYTYERYTTDETFIPDEVEILSINHIKSIIKLIEEIQKIRKESKVNKNENNIKQNI